MAIFLFYTKKCVFTVFSEFFVRQGGGYTLFVFWTFFEKLEILEKIPNFEISWKSQNVRIAKKPCGFGVFPEP